MSDAGRHIAEFETELAQHAEALNVVAWAALDFAETPGAGTYTATLHLPAGSAVLHAVVGTSAAWDADTAAIAEVPGPQERLVFDGGSVKALGSDVYGAVFGYDAPPATYDVDTDVDFVLTTTGEGGSTGRTRVWVCIGCAAPTAIAAVKADA